MIRRISHKQKQHRIYPCIITMIHVRDALIIHNDQRHVTAFRLISEAAHSWSYDNIE